MQKNNYKKFFLMHGISLVIMFFIMYVMIDTVDHFYLNVNRFYMALLMVAPMAILKILFMRSMYNNKKINAGILVLSGALIVFVLFFVRNQSFVGNNQFLRSMIPHHSSAILMCEESSFEDDEIETLCKEIVETQKREIEQMKDIYARLN